jgi:hypothetical protein
MLLLIKSSLSFSFSLPPSLPPPPPAPRHAALSPSLSSILAYLLSYLVVRLSFDPPLNTHQELKGMLKSKHEALVHVEAGNLQAVSYKHTEKVTLLAHTTPPRA